MKEQITRARFYFNQAEEGASRLNEASRWPVNTNSFCLSCAILFMHTLGEFMINSVWSASKGNKLYISLFRYREYQNMAIKPKRIFAQSRIGRS